MTIGMNKNSNRKSYINSLGENTSTARSIENTFNIAVNGESRFAQGTDPAVVTKNTFDKLHKTELQNRDFVSVYDTPDFPVNPQIYITPTPNKDNNTLKGTEQDTGTLYPNNLASSAKDKSQNGTVTQDNNPSVQRSAEIQSERNTGNFNGTASGSGVEKERKQIIESDNYGKKDEEKPVEKKRSSKKSTSQPFVIIEEDREDNISLQEPGEYSDNTHIRIEVLRAVSPFTFGTRQEFDPVEPRGSQTPMRFYNKNPGRSLGFSADFHQQEYPLEPLLSIAEKAQYLCRPYRHGDYSLIPKLVRVTIPGRVFRGYLQSADITYQGDDYRSWAVDQYRPTEQKVHNSLPYYEKKSKTNPFYEYPIEENQTNRIRNDVDTYHEAIDYGLSEISIRFDLLITEEIKLTSFMTKSEKAALAQAEEDARKRKKIEEALQKAREFLKRHPEYDNLMPDDLVSVDSTTGEYSGLLFDENTDTFTGNIPEGSVTYKQYVNSRRVKSSTTNKDSGLTELLMSLPGLARTQASKEDMINTLIQVEHNKYPAKDIIKIRDEFNAKYENNQDLLLKDYKESILDAVPNSTLGSDQAQFLDMTYNIKINPETGDIVRGQFKIPEKLRAALDINVADEKLLSDLQQSIEVVKSFITIFTPLFLELSYTTFKYTKPFLSDPGWDKYTSYPYPESSGGGYIPKGEGLLNIICKGKAKENIKNAGIAQLSSTYGSLSSYESWGFTISALEELKILNILEISYLKEYYKEVKGHETDKNTIITFNDILINSKFLYFQEGSSKNRSFLDHVLKTFKVFQDSTYEAIRSYILNKNKYCVEDCIRGSDGLGSDHPYERELIEKRTQKIFSDKDARDSQLKYDNSKFIEDPNNPQQTVINTMNKNTLAKTFNYMFFDVK